MKKKAVKLALNRETLSSLDGLRSALGAAVTFGCSVTHACSVTCGYACVTDFSDPCSLGTTNCPSATAC
jgi:hypothetical protein